MGIFRTGLGLVALLLCCGGSAFGQIAIASKNLKPATMGHGYARDTGLVEELSVEVGAIVEQGQILMKLDHARQLHAWQTAKLKADSEAPMESLQGEMRQKEAQLIDTQNRLRRRQASEVQVEVAQGEVDVTRGKMKQAKLNAALAKLDLELAEKLLELRYVRSPISGTVVEIARTPGQRAAAGDVLITVADMSNVEMELPLSGHVLKTLQTGDSVPVRLAGTQGATFAQVASMAPIAGAKNGEQMVRFVFSNASPDVALSGQKYELLMPEGTKIAPISQASPAPKPKG